MANTSPAEFHVNLGGLDLAPDARDRIASEIQGMVVRELAKTDHQGVQIHIPKGWYGIIAGPLDKTISLADAFPNLK